MEQISTFVADPAADGARSLEPPSLADLRASVVSTVLAHPGVLRLEPTLAGVLQDQAAPGAGACGGVVLGLEGALVGVEVNLSTRAGHQVLRTVVELRAELSDLVRGLGLTGTSVTINVLDVEPAEERSPAPVPAQGPTSVAPSVLGGRPTGVLQGGSSPERRHG